MGTHLAGSSRMHPCSPVAAFGQFPTRGHCNRADHYRGDAHSGRRGTLFRGDRHGRACGRPPVFPRLRRILVRNARYCPLPGYLRVLLHAVHRRGVADYRHAHRPRHLCIRANLDSPRASRRHRRRFLGRSGHRLDSLYPWCPAGHQSFGIRRAALPSGGRDPDSCAFPLTIGHRHAQPYWTGVFGVAHR